MLKIHVFCNDQLIHFHCSIKQIVKAKLLNLQQQQDKKKASDWLMKNLYRTDRHDIPVLMSGFVSHITVELYGFAGTSAPYCMSNVTAVLFLDAN